MKVIKKKRSDFEGVSSMYDWNHNGKIDAEDHAFTAFMIDEIENGNTGKPTGGCGCCGTTVAVFLIGILLPVFLTIVFAAH